MTSETIAEILEHKPNVRCFAVGSDDLARRNSHKLARQLPRPKRKQAERKHYLRWKRSIDSIIQDAPNSDFSLIVTRLESLPLEAVHLAFDPRSADELVDKLSLEILDRPTAGIGIWQQFASDSVVFIWLWDD